MLFKFHNFIETVYVLMLMQVLFVLPSWAEKV